MLQGYPEVFAKPPSSLIVTDNLLFHVLLHVSRRLVARQRIEFHTRRPRVAPMQNCRSMKTLGHLSRARSVRETSSAGVGLSQKIIPHTIKIPARHKTSPRRGYFFPTHEKKRKTTVTSVIFHIFIVSGMRSRNYTRYGQF